MRGSVCAYWLRLGLLLVCRSLRLSWALVCGALLGVFALLCFAPFAGWISGLGLVPAGLSDQRWLPAGVDSPLVERLWAVLDGFPNYSQALSAWASVCVCVLWAGWISGQWMHARMDV